MNHSRPHRLALALVLLFGSRAAAAAQDGWSAYGGDATGTRWSPLHQVDRTNVDRLQPAWSFRTGELGQSSVEGEDELTFESTPVLFEGSLLVTTAFGTVIALDPLTGDERWRHDPRVPRDQRYSEHTNRGIAVWRDAAAAPGARCTARVFIGTLDARLVALDARDGQRCPAFADGGVLDLRALAGVEEGSGDYQITSAPTVVNDVVVVGTSIGDNWSVDTGPGTVRGIDARTGRVVWGWEPIPRGAASAGRVGAANAWSTFAADPRRDLVFVPTSSPSPDFYGGLRPGDDRWGNAVVALRGSTGELVWGFQTVHHDLFDYDVAPQPMLIDLERDGERVPALVQANKTGFIFVLHRETGEPLFPIEERPAPPSTVPGEKASPTQPWPSRPAPLIPTPDIDPENPWGTDPEHVTAYREMARGFRWDGFFTPPSLEGSILYPGNGAGTNWGGAAFDPSRGLLIVPTVRYATLVRLIPRAEEEAARKLARERGMEMGRQRGAPYAMIRDSWRGPSGIPCTAPPWGVISAVDLADGDVIWEVPWGHAPGALANGGYPAAGGPIVTAGGLVFIAGSRDYLIRALDVETGAELWHAELPRAGIATPMTYRGADGKQYLVIAAGGHGKAGLEIGDWIVAYALPEDSRR